MFERAPDKVLTKLKKEANDIARDQIVSNIIKMVLSN